MRVLSLFDGIACGYEALLRAWIKVDKYYSSEIDKYAIQIAQKNHPDIIQLGDINEREKRPIEPEDIDMIIGGSPCQGFSMAWRMLNFNDPRSALFFKFVEILQHYKPKYRLLENVKMKWEFRDKISELLGVQPILIDSAKVSAQHRERYYRTNIPWVTQPEDKWIMLKDVIIQEDVEEKYYLTDTQIKTIQRNFWAKGKILNEKESLIEKQTYPSRINQIEWLDIKCPTLCTAMGTWWWNVPAIAYAPSSREYRQQWWKEDKSPTLAARDYKDPKIVAPQGMSKLIEVVNGEVRIKQATKQWYAVAEEWDGIDLSYPWSTTRRARVVKGKSNTIVTWWKAWVYNKVIRKLTPIECERLQTLPDNYTEWVSNTQRYKALGNGRTVEVIAHIFKNLENV